MDTEGETNPAAVIPPAAAEFHWGRFALWLPACCVQGAVLAWAAVVVQEYFAPWLIFPLLVGVVLGATGVGLMRLGQIGHRPTVLLGSILAVLTTVVGQHYISYCTARDVAQEESETFRLARQLQPELLEGAAPMPAEGFLQFMRWQAARGRPVGGYIAQGPVAWLTWGLDGLLVLAAAGAVAVPASRQPYCSRCRSWFRATRSGRIDPQAARRLASAAGLPIPDEPAQARYRLVACHGGCGPTGFELCWEHRRGKTPSARIWLDVERRNQIVETLDKNMNRQ